MLRTSKKMLAGLPTFIVGIVLLIGVTTFLLVRFGESDSRQAESKQHVSPEVEHAWEHLQEVEEARSRILAMSEERKPLEEIYEAAHEMVEHDEHITRSLLAAEEKGVDLHAEGLIKAFCDSLEAQYEAIVTVNGGILTDENRPERLQAIMNRGVDLGTAAERLRVMLHAAMQW